MTNLKPFQRVTTGRGWREVPVLESSVQVAVTGVTVAWLWVGYGNVWILWGFQSVPSRRLTASLPLKIGLNPKRNWSSSNHNSSGVMLNFGGVLLLVKNCRMHLVIVSPLSLGLWDPFQIAFLWPINGGDPNHLLNGMILQVGREWMDLGGNVVLVVDNCRMLLGKMVFRMDAFGVENCCESCSTCSCGWF